MESNLTLTNIFADGLGCINHQQKMRRFNGRDRRLTKTNQRIFVGLKPPGSRGWMAVLGGKTWDTKRWDPPVFVLFSLKPLEKSGRDLGKVNSNTRKKRSWDSMSCGFYVFKKICIACPRRMETKGAQLGTGYFHFYIGLWLSFCLPGTLSSQLTMTRIRSTPVE